MVAVSAAPVYDPSSWAVQADPFPIYARMQEVFAGFLEHIDAQVGKLVEAIEQMGLRDDTLIIYIVGDNGASAEGGLEGTANEIASLNGIQLGLDGLLRFRAGCPALRLCVVVAGDPLCI